MTPTQITKAAQSAYARTLAVFTPRWGEQRARELALNDAAQVATYLALELATTADSAACEKGER